MFFRSAEDFSNALEKRGNLAFRTWCTAQKLDGFLPFLEKTAKMASKLKWGEPLARPVYW